MKRKLLACILVIGTFLACKKDATEKNADRLTGRWIVEQVAEISYENGMEKHRRQNSAPDDKQICEFREDGTATVNLDGGNVDVKWALEGSKLKLSPDDQITVDLNIRSLTYNSLLLEYEDSSETVNGITYRHVLEFKMRK